MATTAIYQRHLALPTTTNYRCLTAARGDAAQQSVKQVLSLQREREGKELRADDTAELTGQGHGRFAPNSQILENL